MPPRSPLAQRHGLDAAWVRTPDRRRGEPLPWLTMAEWLHERLPEPATVAQMLGEGGFVYEDGRPVRPTDAYRPHTFVWFHRELREEPPVPGSIDILHRDERLLVVDKPPFLSSIPRGRHVLQSVVARLREEMGIAELTPVHRLDRVTSGVLMLTVERRWRGPYQLLFQQRRVHKTYRALAPLDENLVLPTTMRNHIRKHAGAWRAEVVPGAPINAETKVELESQVGDMGCYRLTPITGRTHQLRLHMLGLGIPIVGDPLYPDIQEVAVDDFSRPLQLLAAELEFTDPVDGSPRRFRSARPLPIAPERPAPVLASAAHRA